MSSRRDLALAALFVAALGCRDRDGGVTTLSSAAGLPGRSSAAVDGSDRSARPRPAAVAPAPADVEDIDVPGDLTAFVVRGVGTHRLMMLFLPGMCVHPGGYVLAFRRAAAARGDLVALQGDVSCGGDGSARRWSADLEAMDRRVDEAFRASGLGEPRNVVVIGYSQGADRAEHLVARWPDKYDRAVLIGSPTVPSPRTLGRAKAVVLMAGTDDSAEGPMRAAVAPLRRVAVPATFLELPGARHGQMGDDPERSMGAALDFVHRP